MIEGKKGKEKKFTNDVDHIQRLPRICGIHYQYDLLGRDMSRN
jgi:hypothetical protein